MPNNLMKLDEMCVEYVNILNGPVNAWGQQVHPMYGISHEMLRKMHVEFGRHKTNAAIDKAFKKGGE